MTDIRPQKIQQQHTFSIRFFTILQILLLHTLQHHKKVQLLNFPHNSMNNTSQTIIQQPITLQFTLSIALQSDYIGGQFQFRQIFINMSKGLRNEQHFQIPRLKIQPVQRGFAEHKKCLKLCLRAFDTSNLSQPERTCIHNCLGKYRESERYLTEKMHHFMQAYAMQSAQVKSMYNGTSEQAQATVGDKV